VSLLDVKDDTVFTDIYSDIYDKCSIFGKVLDIKIPRPVWVDRTENNRAEDEELERIIIENHEMAKREF
jgi:hypothetical protein